MFEWLRNHAPMTQQSIPLNKPFLGPEERRAALDALEGLQLGGNGPLGREAEAYLQDLFGVHHLLLTTSCTHAMEMAMMALDLSPGDEVIMPSFTFVTTATAVVRLGARPVFADIDERSFNLEPDSVAERITARTRAIMPVHYAGQACDMQAIMSLAREHGLKIIEDAAHGVGAKYEGRYLGTIGDAGCYSFHITKNVTCGEGGAFLTNDEDLARRCEIIREKGTNRSQFLRGEVDKYTWVDIGSSFVLSDLLAAILLEQIRKLDEILQRRRVIWERYQAALKDLENRGEIVLPHLGPQRDSSWHIYAIRTVKESSDRVIQALREKGIGATFHFVPLHLSPYAQEHLGCVAGDLPVTERVSRTLIRLPIYPSLTEHEQDYVIQALHESFDRK
jgi:dTDP-4-amino-4,6-dideoxygalactose transaminase